jgi:hypothetical protein
MGMRISVVQATDITKTRDILRVEGLYGCEITCLKEKEEARPYACDYLRATAKLSPAQRERRAHDNAGTPALLKRNLLRGIGRYPRAIRSEPL